LFLISITQNTTGYLWRILCDTNQYAKLKGDLRNSNRRSNRLANVTSNKKPEPQENIFAEIANMPKPKSKFKPRFKGRKRSKKIKCLYCNSIVNEKNIERHIRKVHPGEQPLSSATKKAELQNRRGRNSKSDRPHLVPEGQEGNMGEAFRQAFNEKRDGSKDFAHFRRQWDGKYGSHPLHDDYSDESNAD
jgi:hypothetical protein